MLKKFIIWLKGYLIICLSGNSKDRTINLCLKNGINIWRISESDGCKTIYISKNGYKELIPYLEKTGTKAEIIDKKGMPYLFFRYKKRKIFLLGLLLFFGIIYSFSFFIWDINISGEKIYTDEQIIQTLNDYNIRIGTAKGKINCTELEKILRAEYDDIAWISCELKGTRLNISINETIAPDMIKENTVPCNIVAAKDGLITDIYIESGTRVAGKGDEVKKGDILITGAINLYNDYDELIETSYVPANGQIYAVVSYEYHDSFSMDYYEKEYTGNQKKYFGLIIGDKAIKLPKSNKKYNNYDIATDEIRLKLGSFFYLPVSVKKSRVMEYEPVLKKYTDKEADMKARNKLNAYIEELNKKGVEILENNVKIEINGDICKADGTIVTKELIGIPADITIINQGEEADGIY